MCTVFTNHCLSVNLPNRFYLFYLITEKVLHEIFIDISSLRQVLIHFENGNIWNQTVRFFFKWDKKYMTSIACHCVRCRCHLYMYYVKSFVNSVIILFVKRSKDFHS